MILSKAKVRVGFGDENEKDNRLCYYEKRERT